MSDMSKMMAEAYERDSKKPEVISFIHAVCMSRKYGFPITCAISDRPQDERLACAARLLIDVAQSYPYCDLPEKITLQQGTKLYEDAMSLLENAAMSSVVLVKSDCSQLKDAPIGESIVSNTSFKFNIADSSHDLTQPKPLTKK